MPGANSYSSPSTAGGNREYLRNVLTVLEPEGSPVISMAKKGEDMKGTFAEVLADTFRPARLEGRPEGQDSGAGTNNAEQRERFGNYFHILREDFFVTDVQEGAEQAAIDSEYDYEKAKGVSQLKRDMEAVACGNQEMVRGSGEIGWQGRGLTKWSSTTAQATNPVPAQFLTPAASVKTGVTVTNDVSDLTEAQLNAVLQSMFKVYGKAMTFQMVAAPDTIAAVDNFSRVNSSGTNIRYQVMDEASKKAIMLSVKTFESSFGLVHLLPSMFVNIDTTGIAPQTLGFSTLGSALILNMALIEIQFYRKMRLFTKDLPDHGGGPRGFAKCGFSVCCKNPKGLGRISVA